MTGSVAGNIVDNSILAINGNDSPIVANTISGTGALQQNGADNVFLTGTNTFTGTTTIANGGTLTLSAPAAGTTSLALQNSTLNYTTGTLLFDTAVNVATLGGLTGTQNIALSNTNATPAAVTLNVGNNGSSTTYSGALTGTGSLVKVGSGTLTLAGANTYTGTTTDNLGNLIITGSLGTQLAPSGGMFTNSGTVTYNGGTSYAPLRPASAGPHSP